MLNGKRATKSLYKSNFDSLYEAVLEAQTILVNYKFYDDVRILADTGKCLRVIRRYK